MQGRTTLDIILNILKKGQGSEEATKELGGLEKAAKTAGKALLAYVSVESLKATYELAKLGAQSLRTKSAFEAISGGSRAASENLEAMRVATRGAMSETDMMAVASQMLQMGLVDNAEGLGEMTEMAVRLGSAMGMEAGPAMENWNLMIANQSIPRLDSYGISGAKVRERILELQAATAGMSREQAFMIAVTEEGTNAMDRLGPAMDDAALSFEQVEAKVQDLTTEFAEKLAPAISTAIDAGILLLTWNEQIDEATASHAMGVAELAGSYEEYVLEVMRAQGVTEEVMERILASRNATLEGGGAAEYLANRYGVLAEAEFNVLNATDAATIGWANATAVMGGQTAAAQAAAQATRDLAAAEAEAAVQAGIQAKETGDLSQSLMDATSGQIASRMIGMLDPQKMGADAYGTAVAEIGLEFGIMDEKSIALAENMGALAEAIESGVIPAEDADEALSDFIEDAEDGQVDIENLVEGFDDLSYHSESAGVGMEHASRGMRGISENVGEAVESVDKISDSASIASDDVWDLADGLGTTESELRALAAGSPYTFSFYATSGGEPIEDVNPFSRTAASRTDARQYNRETNVTNYITTPAAAAILLNEQRGLTSRRIERGF